MNVDRDILLDFLSYINNATGTCTVVGQSGTYSGTATVTASGNTATYICNFTPNANDIVSSISITVNTCLGQLTLTISGLNYSVIANYAHTAIIKQTIVSTAV